MPGEESILIGTGFFFDGIIDDYNAFLCFHPPDGGFSQSPQMLAGEIFFREKAGDFIMDDASDCGLF
ncbi:MAG: hypothetical protein PHU23_03660 [Dehalococcoidales bacterium]|nr:hypothetical protein [Dehalococcoidales bacterium]